MTNADEQRRTKTNRVLTKCSTVGLGGDCPVQVDLVPQVSGDLAVELDNDIYDETLLRINSMMRFMTIVLNLTEDLNTSYALTEDFTQNKLDDLLSRT